MTGTPQIALTPSAGRPPWRLPALLLAAALLAIVTGVLADRWSVGNTVASPDPATLRPWYGPASYAQAAVNAERDVNAARHDNLAVPGQWLREEVLARALMARWRLKGDYADLVEARALLDQGLRRAPYPAGPVFSRALLSLTVHRLDDAETMLARVADFAVVADDEAADARTFAGDIALQRGRLAEAERLFAEAERIAPSPGGNLRGAILRFNRGDRAGGLRVVERLLANPRQQPQALATLMLQRANFAYAEGDWSEAGRWVGAAQRAFPGFWLADAYAAQQFALAGRTDDAIRAYTRVAQRSGRPEVMDALAHLLRLKGDGAASRVWAAKADAGWARHGALFPEAVAHHRAEHELAVGSAARALAYAEPDARARPQAPNLVLLARALLSAGRPREALALLDRADAQGWISAGQHMARAEVEAALGNGAASEAARARAEKLNPRAADPRTRLIWFGHD